MVAPGAVEGLSHLFQPLFSEGRLLLGDDKSITQGASAASSGLTDDVVLPPQHKRLLVEPFRYFGYEQGVHVRIDASVLEQLLESDEIGVVSVLILFNPFIAVAEGGDEIIQTDPDRLYLLSYELPVSAPGFVTVVKINLLRPVYHPAGLDAQVVYEVEWLGLFFQSEDKMELFRYSSTHLSILSKMESFFRKPFLEQCCSLQKIQQKGFL